MGKEDNYIISNQKSPKSEKSSFGVGLNNAFFNIYDKNMSHELSEPNSDTIDSNKTNTTNSKQLNISNKFQDINVSPINPPLNNESENNENQEKTTGVTPEFKRWKYSRDLLNGKRRGFGSGNDNKNAHKNSKQIHHNNSEIDSNYSFSNELNLFPSITSSSSKATNFKLIWNLLKDSEDVAPISSIATNTVLASGSNDTKSNQKNGKYLNEQKQSSSFPEYGDTNLKKSNHIYKSELASIMGLDVNNEKSGNFGLIIPKLDINKSITESRLLKLADPQNENKIHTQTLQKKDISEVYPKISNTISNLKDQYQNKLNSEQRNSTNSIASEETIKELNSTIKNLKEKVDSLTKKLEIQDTYIKQHQEMFEYAKLMQLFSKKNDIINENHIDFASQQYLSPFFNNLESPVQSSQLSESNNLNYFPNTLPENFNNDKVSYNNNYSERMKLIQDKFFIDKQPEKEYSISTDPTIINPHYNSNANDHNINRFMELLYGNKSTTNLSENMPIQEKENELTIQNNYNNKLEHLYQSPFNDNAIQTNSSFKEFEDMLKKAKNSIPTTNQIQAIKSDENISKEISFNTNNFMNSNFSINFTPKSKKKSKISLAETWNIDTTSIMPTLIPEDFGPQASELRSMNEVKTLFQDLRNARVDQKPSPNTSSDLSLQEDLILAASQRDRTKNVIPETKRLFSTLYEDEAKDWTQSLDIEDTFHFPRYKKKNWPIL